MLTDLLQFDEIATVSSLQLVDKLELSSLHVCLVNIELKYNFVETPREFIIAIINLR